MKPTLTDVLAAIPRAAGPWSNYIIDRLQRDHARRVALGGTGHPPSAALVLRRLKKLETMGHVTRSQFTNGYYGYRWDITDAGHAALPKVGA